MPSFSDKATSILAILNNINELIVQSSDRKSASDVMRALVVYGKNMKFDLPKEKIENWFAILIDARPYTLTSLLKDIAEDVVSLDSKLNKR
jgi:hypothetical protein